MKPTIRALTRSDWQDVRAIYLDGISTGQATFETDAPEWHEWNDLHLEACRLVARTAAGIVGWAALSPVSSRRVYAGVAEVSVYVAAAARGQGVGRSLLERLVAESENAGIWTLQAGVFPENTASIRLHHACGFRDVGIQERPGRLRGTWKDVLLMERRSRRVGC